MIRVSNSLDPDQDWHNVGPDLTQNCLQRSSADNKKSLVAKKISWLSDLHSFNVDICFDFSEIQNIVQTKAELNKINIILQ